MTYKALISTIIIILALVTGAIAQPTTDEQLAVHYFQSGEYDKAAVYYEKLYNKKPSDFYYNYYLRCLIQLENYQGAEKLAKKQLKRFSTNLVYLVDLGNIYNKLEEHGKARQQFEKALKRVVANQSTVTRLAKAFLEIGENQLAMVTYQKGKKLLKGYYPFNYEIAEVYGAMGQYDEMVKEYLDLLELNTNYLQSVQNALNRNMGFQEETEQSKLLKSELLRRVQRNPNKTVYAEMLIWMFIQQKDFNGAFVQARAIDRRLKEEGERLTGLARICTSNGQYDIAIRCYQYVIDKGDVGYYYINSRMELLKVMNTKIVDGNYTQEELTKLEQNYYATIDELGKNPGTVSLLKELAHLQSYYLNKTDSAASLLEEAIDIPRVRPHLQAECKLELGDILVMKNDIWEASLLYSQVEKAFKYDPLGQQAKFRNARIAYYTGDFSWAKAQLNVLKGSTSKLIANDALDLSLLITDNTGIDTSLIPMMMYARADLLTTQNRDEQAIITLDSINTIYPGHALSDEVLYQRYKIAVKHRNYEKAAGHLERIIEGYWWDLLGDDAMFKLAELNENRLNNKEKAMELYQRILKEFPGSLYVVEARKRFRQLRGDKLGDDKPEPGMPNLP